jgi:hypothetical protein
VAWGVTSRGGVVRSGPGGGMPHFFMGKPLESVEHVAFFMENVWFAMGFIVWPLNGKTKEHHLFVKLDMQHMNISI